MQTLSTQQALKILEQYWNMVGEIKMLPSYADQNFKISTATQSYVLKIANPQSSYDDLDLENAALLHLEKTCTTLTLPKVIAGVDGQYLIPFYLDHHNFINVESTNSGNDDQHQASNNLCINPNIDQSKIQKINQSNQDNQGLPSYCRLLTYIEGDVYAHVAKLTDKTPTERWQLLHSLGSAVGKVAYGMRDFTHANAQRNLDWNINNLPSLMTEIDFIEESPLRSIVQKHMHYFAQQLPHWLTTLPITVNHNDANDLNVIVDPLQHQKVCAIIDFGDTCTSFRIADVAITCTYAIAFEENIVQAMAMIMHGYHQENPLQSNEIQALYAFIMARMCQSILMANKAYRHNPENHYILVSQQSVRRLIQELDVLNPEDVYEKLMQQ